MKRPGIIALFVIALLATLACKTLLPGSEANQQENNSESNRPSDNNEPSQPRETATPEINILFEDDFSDPDSGWDRADWSTGLTDYQDGSYTLLVKQANYDIWANPGLYFEGDVRIEVDATKVDGEDDDDFGLICRYTGDPSSPSFYFFWISSDGYAAIGKVTEGEMEFISGENMESNDAIRRGKATNHLRADCIGSSLTLYVNGELAASAVDSDFSGGDIGFMAGTYEIPFSEISFDNLLVTEP